MQCIEKAKTASLFPFFTRMSQEGIGKAVFCFTVQLNCTAVWVNAQIIEKIESLPEIRIGLNESHIRKCSSKYNFRKQCSKKETNELFAQGYSFCKKKDIL